jgi:hypothetical protein
LAGYTQPAGFTVDRRLIPSDAMAGIRKKKSTISCRPGGERGIVFQKG